MFPLTGAERIRKHRLNKQAEELAKHLGNDWVSANGFADFFAHELCEKNELSPTEFNEGRMNRFYDTLEAMIGYNNDEVTEMMNKQSEETGSSYSEILRKEQTLPVNLLLHAWKSSQEVVT
jgi:hypothetical protein